MRLDRPDLTVPERAETIEELRREIVAAWETEEIRPRRPDPLDEVTSGLLIFEQTLWDALPRYLQSLDAALAQGHRPDAAARRGADPVRLVDRRRPRRQPVRDAGGHARRLPARRGGGPPSCTSAKSTRCGSTCR